MLSTVRARFPVNVRVFEQDRRRFRRFVHADDDDMHVRVVGGLGVPGERAVREPDAPSLVEQGSEQAGHGLALTDAVRGHERERRPRFGQVFTGLAMPACRVVEIPVIAFVPYKPHVLFLTVAHEVLSDERRVAHHIVAVVAG